ncbi:zinc finger domain-containing protein [Streptomyces sp. NPDC055036]
MPPIVADSCDAGQLMPAAGVSTERGEHRPSSAPIADRYTGVLPLDFPARVDFEELFLALSPRDEIGVDTCSADGEWLHVYKPQALPETPPAGPYAVYLANPLGRFHWIVFDFDSKRGDTLVDVATLLRWLEDAQLTYVVAASGSAGGRHVWVAASTPLESALVRSIAEAAARRLPTLDHGLLCNPDTGGVRPIGAPHRAGGRSQLQMPLDDVRAAELLTPATCRNDSEAFTRLLLIIDAVPAPADVRIRRIGAPVVEVLDDGPEGYRLPGTPNTLLDDVTHRLLTRRPSADKVSEVLAAVLTRLALRRWNWLMVADLLTDTRHREGGLLHACTTAGLDSTTGALRVVLDPRDARKKLKRQWQRCVTYAATLRQTTESEEWTGQIAHVVQVVEQIQAAADAWPERWATESGPADRAALDLRCLLALRSGSLLLALDVRRAALATGFGRSTMHRAQDRLTLDCWLADRESDGPAGTHELLPVTQKHPRHDSEALSEGGGTQRTPPPTKEGREVLITRLEERISAGRVDLFSHGRASLGHAGGLGHHAGRTYQQLAARADRPLSLSELSERTGYAPRTVLRHLTRLRDLLVVTRAVRITDHECPSCQARPGTRCRTAQGRLLPGRGTDQHSVRQALAAERASTAFYRTRSGSLVPAAKALGVHGRTAARARRYAVEIEVYHWWQREEERMHAAKVGIRTGVQVHQEQAALTITTLPRQPHRPYPRTADGAADHQTAQIRVLRRLATV